MPLFGSRNKMQNTNAAPDLERLARGLLPLGAEQRLRHDAETPSFTATRGAREFSLLAGDDVLPVGIVTGSCVYHVGTVWPPMQQSDELTILTTAHVQVRRRALDRLQQEAALLGAHGVLGVKLEFRTRQVPAEQGGELLEYSATGTAVRLTQGTAAAAPVFVQFDRLGVLDPAPGGLPPLRDCFGSLRLVSCRFPGPAAASGFADGARPAAKSGICGVFGGRAGNPPPCR